jgi:hypothetical protein
MKTIHTALVFAASAFSFFGCSAGDPGSGDGEQVASSSASEVKLLDCQKQVASCTLKAKSFKDLGACTAQFQSCSSQAALDLAGAGSVLKDCRSKADACLKGALTLSDVTACRSVFESCTADVGSTAKNVLSEAVGAAGTAIEKTANVAIDTIQKAVGATGPALEAVATCQSTATSCLKGALTTGDVSQCQDVFEDCAGKAVKIVDGAVAPLPGPTPGEIADGFALCQAKSESCLKGALTSFDVSKCKNTLSTCVGNATNLIDQTISDVNSLLPLPLLPGTSKPVNCTTQATECLLSLKNPADCAEQALACAKH